jgi:spore germination protein GerM
MDLRLAQVVYTLMQFPSVKAVNFSLDGKPVTVFGSEGIVLDHPQERSDYEDVAPSHSS